VLRLTLGELLLVLSAVSALGAVILRWLEVRGFYRNAKQWAEGFTYCTLALVLASFLYLAYLFVTSDMAFLYVWRSTSSDLDLIFKISAIWAGKAGSFFLVVLVAAGGAALEVALTERRKLASDFSIRFQFFCMVLVASLIIILIALGPFSPTVATEADAARLIAYPYGRGMEMVLQTWEMVLHPLFVLVSYALCVMVFAASVAFLVTDEKGWPKIALPYGRISWLLLTIGIGLGAFWAYYVVGWSGYWAWDPVETISLVLWLVLAAFLHLIARHAKAGEYPASAPTLGMLVLTTALLAAFITRSGGLWRSSVHTYGSSLDATAGERFVQSLSSDPSLLGLFILMVGTAIFATWMAWHAKTSSSTSTKGALTFSRSNAMSISVLLLSFTALVMLLILIKNVDLDQIANYDEFTGKMPIFFGALAIMLVGCLSLKRLGGKRALWLVLALIGGSLVFASIAWYSGWDVLLGFALAPAILAIVVAAYRLLTSRSKVSLRRTMQSASPHIIHLGVVLVLIGYLASTFAVSVPSSGLVSEVVVGGQLEAAGYVVKLKALNAMNATSPPGLNYDEIRSATLDIHLDGSLRAQDVILNNYYRHIGDETFLLESQPLVLKDIGSDLYVSFISIDNSTAVIEVKVLPLMNVLWSGVIVVVIGIAVRISYNSGKDEKNQ
jgi:cytochrome c-type biogenesis protein CcmF